MKPIFPFRKYIVFDFETTGFDFLHDDVIQMSAIEVENGEIIKKFNHFVKTDKELKPSIIQLTGITQEKLDKDGIDKETAWKAFNEFIGKFALVGHNVICFDRLFLEKNFDDFKLEIPNKHRYIDTAMIFKAKKIDFRPLWHESHYQFSMRVAEHRAKGIRFNLQQCCKDLEIDVTHLTAHQSDSDIEMTLLIYKKFLLELE